MGAANLAFLQGGGEMGARMRGLDWAGPRSARSTRGRKACAAL